MSYDYKYNCHAFFSLTNSLTQKLNIDFIRGTIGYGRTYGEHSYNFLPFPKEEFIIRLAEICYKKGEFNEALRYYKDICKFIIDDSKRVEFIIEIGRIYSEKGNFDEALKYLERVLEKGGSKSKQIEVFGLIGETYRKRGKKQDMQKAEKFYKRAFDIARSIKEDVIEKGMGYHYMAKYYQAKGQYNDAYQLLNKALRIFEKCDYEYGIASVYNNLGIHYFNNNRDIPSAIQYFKNAKSIFKKLNSQKDVNSIKKNISTAIGAKGRKIYIVVS